MRTKDNPNHHRELEGNLTRQDLDLMTHEMQRYADRISALAGRVVKDVVRFYWGDGSTEDVHFTGIWKQIRPCIWGIAVDTVSEQASLLVVAALKGCTLPMHSFERQTVIYVAEGAINLNYDGEPRIIETDEVVKMKPGLRHEIMFLEETLMTVKLIPRRALQSEPVVATAGPVALMPT